MQHADQQSRRGRAEAEAEPSGARGRAPGKERRAGLGEVTGASLEGVRAEPAGRRAESLRAGDWEPNDALMVALGLRREAPSAAQPARADAPVQALGGALPGAASRAPSGRDAPDAPDAPDAAHALDSPDAPGAPNAAHAHDAAARGVADASAPLPHFEVIQRAFGRHDLRRLRAQIGGAAAQATEELGARAYAMGSRVAFSSSPDLRTAAHEAAHVVQQASGRVQLADGVGRAGDEFERHADAVADAVVAGQSAEPLLDAFVAGAGSAASDPRTTVQRDPDYRSGAQLKGLTLREFDRYAHAQADWAMSDDVFADRGELRALLAFARANKGLVLGACGSFRVHALLKHRLGQGEAADEHAIAYSKSASPGRRAGTIQVEARATRVSQLLAWGAAIARLEQALDPLLVASVVRQHDGIECLYELVEDHAVEDFVQYVQGTQPMLHATNGKEIYCFLEFRKSGGLSQLDRVRAELPEILSPHRFTVEQLSLLCEHRARAKDNPNRHEPQPICVVLQTGVDSTAVFGHNAALTELLQRGSHLVLLAEGRPTLAAFAADLERFAALGPGGQIDELVISAHGSATTQKLAGTVKRHVPKGESAPVYGVSSSTSLDAGANRPNARTRTGQFFTLVRALLRDHPDSRLVLNGCLTASNHPRGSALAPDPDQAAEQLLESIAAQPNLATFVRSVMDGHQAQVRGANASFAAAKSTLVGADGRADLVLAEDPALTTPDKLEYLEFGHEPTGVMRALLECWARDRGAARDAVTRRLSAREADLTWRECILRGAFKLALARFEDATQLQQLSEGISGLWHLKQRQGAQVSKLRSKASAELLVHLEEDARKADLWTSEETEFLPLVFLQAILSARLSARDDLAAFLDGPAFTPQNAAHFFDLEVLAPHLEALLTPRPEPQTFRRSSLLLALLFLSAEGANAPATAKRYVEAVAGPAQELPKSCAALLKGLNERRLLKHAGVLGEGAPQAVRPNVVTRFGGDNEVAVRSLTRRCRARADLEELPLFTLPSGEPAGEAMPMVWLHVVGELTVTCPELEPMVVDDEPTLFTGRAPGEPLALLAVEWVGPFPTAFVERALVELR
ncbi:MAG: DUF4157 domain-containing protein [Kofleriaceae bacterium]